VDEPIGTSKKSVKRKANDRTKCEEMNEIHVIPVIESEVANSVQHGSSTLFRVSHGDPESRTRRYSMRLDWVGINSPMCQVT
jgi:hypothetical protein